jgi:hypothetical protein
VTAHRSIFGRPLAVALLVYQALFLNVLLPGHTRGSVTLDGKHVAKCCCCDGGGSPDAKSPATPSQRDRDHCALCDFAARVMPPDVFVLRLDPIGLVARLPVPSPAAIESLERIATYLGTGPPVAHA